MTNKIKTSNPITVHTGVGTQEQMTVVIELTRVELRSNFNNLYLYYTMSNDENQRIIKNGEFNLMLDQIDNELDACEINLEESNYRDSMRCIAMSILLKKIAEILNISIEELEIME
jgi:hypothetical protein